MDRQEWSETYGKRTSRVNIPFILSVRTSPFLYCLYREASVVQRDVEKDRENEASRGPNIGSDSKLMKETYVR